MIKNASWNWSSPIYAFFATVPDIAYIDRAVSHFRCLRKSCKQSMWWFLDKIDRGSTDNMHKHIKACWGEDILNGIGKVPGLDGACKAMYNIISV